MTSVTEEPRDETAQSLPPSHILQDGRSVHLPPPTEAERQRFLERSIARYGLLESDLSSSQPKDAEKSEKKEATIHPLAVASARLQANGISELSKAINLSGLVSSGEYFGLTNIIVEQAEKKTAEEEKIRAEYIGKRKRSQFQQASKVLERQERRLAAAISAQRVVDERLQQLRPRWRLVAPEHGTRAQPHATRPTELVAIDVHVFDRDRTGGGNQAVLLESENDSSNIARRVPRFATIELQNDYKVNNDLEAWKEQYGISTENDDDMKVESSSDNNEKDSTHNGSIKTRAEPFAVLDPTLGKIDVDFDPSKVPMLTLQFDISKPSTGFLQSTRLSSSQDEDSDERVVSSLQHSLFCASLFESIRRELVPNENDKTVGGVTNKSNRTVWLSSEMDENFLPPPSLMAGGEHGIPSLAVISCQDGEIMVQLDCEYSLTVKLVQAEAIANDTDADAMDVHTSTENIEADSGSQTPEQLQVLCRALLLHAQCVFHEHSVKAKAKSLEKEAKPAPGLVRIQKKDKMPPARILESCVSLGSKMILERKIRHRLRRVSEWTRSTFETDEQLKVEWLPLSTFDSHSQFTLSFSDECMDVGIDREEIKVTITGTNGGFRQVRFHLDTELELFLKIWIRRCLKSLQYENDSEAGALTPPISNLDK
jgi:hypothetical protein